MAEDDEGLLLDNQVCFALYSAANAIVRAYRPLLIELDLTYLQYLVMMVLWQSNGINVKTLGEKLHLDSGTLTPLLKRLEGKKLVQRRVSQRDERVKELFLTEQGMAVKQKALSIPDAMFCKMNLPAEELMMLKGLCEKVTKTLA
ncbi:transcriptional regulator OhrR [Celerinatantimonas diazotrophica]|nr:MarR family transcriptional regulator [Celerinatantimonas diazotrophica]